jgi:hypothetical protein
MSMSDPRADAADGLQLLATVDPAAYAIMLPAGVDHPEAHRHLTALLADSASAETAGLFAVPRPAGNRIEFRVPAGRIARFDELDGTGRAALRAELGRLASLLRRSAEARAMRDPGRFGHLPALVRAAIEIPSFEHVYAREGRPVLAAWGLSPAGAAGGLGLVRVLDDGVPAERPARISARTLAIAVVGLIVVGGGAVLAAPSLGRLFEPAAPVCTVVPAEREALVGLDDERRRERELRAQLAALEQQLGARRANCPIPVIRVPVPQVAPPPQITPQVTPQVTPTPPPVATREPRPPPPQVPMERPPDTQPCNAETRSGGAGITTTRHFLGPKPGPVRLSYNAFAEPDRIAVYYRGQELATTNGYRAGTGSIDFNWNPPPGGAPNSYVVTVEVTGNPGSRSTLWIYKLACPVAR